MWKGAPELYLEMPTATSNTGENPLTHPFTDQ